MPARIRNPWGWLGYDGIRHPDPWPDGADALDAATYAMSSTRDPIAREDGERAGKSDFYETGAWCVHRLLDLNLLPKTGHWLEPGAGKGAIVRAVHDWQPAHNGVDVRLRAEDLYRPQWTVVEINSGFGKELQVNLEMSRGQILSLGERQPTRLHDDFLRCRSDQAATLTPNGGLHDPMWRHVHARAMPGQNKFDVIIGNPPYSLALEFIKASQPIGKTIAFLLRLNFFGSVKRHEFFRNWMPDIYVLPNRPSFSEDGQTDSIEYAWFVWNQETMDQRVGRIALLDLTPAAERKR